MASPMTLPLIADYQRDRVFVWLENGKPVTCGQALADIQAVAARLTPRTSYINLCQERYCFIVAFAAVGVAGGSNLLPQGHGEEVVAELRTDYPNAIKIDDAQIERLIAGTFTFAEAPAESPKLDASHRMAVVSTSGSTGKPERHDKYWGDLVLGAELYKQCLFGDDLRPNIVATVPPQHMYGLETSVMPALQFGMAVDAGRPFMPWAVSESLARLPGPRLLVTTPVHLRACLQADVVMPDITRVISATAPLDAELAGAMENAWQTEVCEIYGSTETGSVASRQTMSTDVWTLFDGMALSIDDGVWIHGPQLPDAMQLGDDIEVLDAHRFRLLGRAGDLLKMAGKRISLNELTYQLQAIEGVHDAVVFQPDDAGSSRPAALVVAPGLAKREITAQLAHLVDSVFVPRPLVQVEALPRNALGKLPRNQLLSLLAQARRTHDAIQS